MGIKHYVDHTTGKIIRETKTGNRIEREEISKGQLENYKAGENIFGCIGAIMAFIIIAYIFGGSY